MQVSGLEACAILRFQGTRVRSCKYASWCSENNQNVSIRELPEESFLRVSHLFFDEQLLLE